jgi:hypothetical protein
MVLEPEFSPSLPFLYSLRQEIKLYIENVTEPEVSFQHHGQFSLSCNENIFQANSIFFSSLIYRHVNTTLKKQL